MQKVSVKTLIQVALLVAAEIILSRWFSFSTWSVKIGFAFVPLAVCAALYGPFWGAVAGGLADFIGAILFPIGPYFPGFTLTNALTGMVFGLFLRRRPASIAGICAATAINCLVLSLLLNSFWISVLYKSPLLAVMPTRLLQCAVMIPVEVVVLTALRRPMMRLAHSV